MNRLARIAIALLALVALPLQAQSVAFAGFTSGCFGLTCTPPGANVFQSAALGGLTYQNSTFAGNTLGGFAAVGNNAAGLGNRSTDNLGAFYLTSAPFSYTGNVFNLAVSFSLPGTASPVYSATLFGQVSTDSHGGVFIDFDNSPQSFAYNNGVTEGTVTFEVNDVSLIAPSTHGLSSIGASGNLWATEQSVTPEPASFALLATGLVGLGAVVRRRGMQN